MSKKVKSGANGKCGTIKYGVGEYGIAENGGERTKHSVSGCSIYSGRTKTMP